MKMKQLISKLSAERMESYMKHPVWQTASQKEMSWEQAAVNHDCIQEAAARLTEHAAEVLKEFVRQYAAIPVEGERLIRELRKSTSLSGAECQLGVAELAEAGILFSVKKVWGESLFFMPSECFIGWQKVFFPYKPEQLTTLERERLMSGTMRSYCRPFSRQLLSAFAELGRSGLGLTLNGTLPKKTVGKLIQAIDLDDRSLKAFDLKWAHADNYPLQAAFVLEAGTALGLLTAEKGSFKWNEAQLRQWLMLENAEREKQLMDWCLALLLPAGIGSAHLAASMTGLQAGEWYSVNGIASWLDELQTAAASSLETSGQSGAMNMRWHELWQSMGWLELVDCEHANVKEVFFRWKSTAPLVAWKQDQASELQSYITVQPNGEMVVEAECPFWIRWELELLAERKSDEQVTVYQLDAASVSRALEQGRTRSSIQSFLVQASGAPDLPATVEALLDAWAKRACRTSFAEVSLLRCDHEEMAAILENDVNLAPLLKQKLGPLDFIVEQGQISEIRRLLQKAGYPARKAVQTEASRDENGAASYPMVNTERAHQNVNGQPLIEGTLFEPSFYIYEAVPLHHFELTNHAGKEKLQSWLQREQVPSMWIKQLRTYHHSTRRELIEQALQWQTPIQLRMKQELRSFVPEKLEHQEEGWAVVGLLRDERQRQITRLTPDMWEEMRLIIPGQESPI